MRHRPLIAAALAAAVGCGLPASAVARIVEVGRTDVAPACPSAPCLAISRTTGYQIKIGDERGAFTVPAAGKIVAWTIRLGSPTKPQIAFFNRGLGGPASAQITVLRQSKRLFSTVVTQSPPQLLAPYFGQTVQFPLGTALNVKKGYVIALTVPTWAPALTPQMSDHSSWRAARPQGKCNDTVAQTAQTTLTQVTQYRCLYKARLTYSATLITRPAPNRGSGG